MADVSRQDAASRSSVHQSKSPWQLKLFNAKARFRDGPGMLALAGTVEQIIADGAIDSAQRQQEITSGLFVCLHEALASSTCQDEASWILLKDQHVQGALLGLAKWSGAGRMEERERAGQSNSNQNASYSFGNHYSMARDDVRVEVCHIV